MPAVVQGCADRHCPARSERQGECTPPGGRGCRMLLSCFIHHKIVLLNLLLCFPIAYYTQMELYRIGNVKLRGHGCLGCCVAPTKRKCIPEPRALVVINVSCPKKSVSVLKLSVPLSPKAYSPLSFHKYKHQALFFHSSLN